MKNWRRTRELLSISWPGCADLIGTPERRGGKCRAKGASDTRIRTKFARVGCVTKHRLNTTVSASLEVLGEAAWLATEGPERRIEEREVRR